MVFLIESPINNVTISSPSSPPTDPGCFRGGGRRDVPRIARRDLQDDERHEPTALVHHVFVLSRRLRFSLVRFFFVTGAERSSDEFPLRTEDLKVEILIRPLHTSKSKFSTDLWTPPSRISKRTSGHLQVQNRPLDASASKFKTDLWTPQNRNTKPTSERETSDPRVLNRTPDTFAGDACD